MPKTSSATGDVNGSLSSKYQIYVVRECIERAEGRKRKEREINGEEANLVIRSSRCEVAM